MLKYSTEFVPYCQFLFMVSIIVNADDKNCCGHDKEMLSFQSYTKISLFPFMTLEFLSVKQPSNMGLHVHNSNFISASKRVVATHFVRGIKAAKWAKC